MEWIGKIRRRDEKEEKEERKGKEKRKERGENGSHCSLYLFRSELWEWFCIILINHIYFLS